MGGHKYKIGLIAVLAIIITAVALTTPNPKSTSPVSQEKDSLDFSSGVSVNGEVITKNDIDKGYAKLPDNLKKDITKEELAERFVNELLLEKEAENQGITTSDEEVEEFVKAMQDYSGVDESEFERLLEENGQTLEEYKKGVKATISISKLLNQKLNLQNIEATDSDIEAIIQENKDEFQEFFDEGGQELETRIRQRIKQDETLEMHKELIDNYLKSLKNRVNIQ